LIPVPSVISVLYHSSNSTILVAASSAFSRERPRLSMSTEEMYFTEQKSYSPQKYGFVFKKEKYDL
jgi:hypothetical protein